MFARHSSNKQVEKTAQLWSELDRKGSKYVLLLGGGSEDLARRLLQERGQYVFTVGLGFALERVLANWGGLSCRDQLVLHCDVVFRLDLAVEASELIHRL